MFNTGDVVRFREPLTREEEGERFEVLEITGRPNKEDRPVDSLMQGPLELTFGKRNLCHVETGEGHPSGQGITLFSVPRKYQAIAEAMVTAYNAVRAVPQQTGE